MRSAVWLGLLMAATAAWGDVRLPPYTRQVLQNGIVLDIVPRNNVPLVTFRVVIKGGVESEPAGLGGLASVTAEALRRGTAKRSAAQFSLELDELGATFQTFADMQSTTITAECLAKDFDKGLDLLADALLHPAFPEDEVTKLIAQRVDAARVMKDNPAAAASEYYRGFFFGAQHPYGQPVDEKTLASIGRSAIADYHKRMYAGRNMIIVVAGDVKPDKAASAIGSIFGGLSGGTSYVWKQAALPRRSASRLAIINKPDATETQFRIGVPGLDRTDPDRIPLWLVNTLFGGRFTSVLNDALRVESGLTYGAGSVFDQNHLPGRITISSFTATANTVKALDMAIEVMNKIAGKGISAEQLSSAKAYLKGTYPTTHLETSDQLADIISEIELFDLTRGEVDDLFSRIDAITLDKANAIARKYLKPENLTLLLLGDAAKLPAEVKKYAPAPLRIEISRPGVRAVP